MTNDMIAVVWLVLAVVTAGIAIGKNRRWKIWFLLSMLGGPVATVWLLALCGNKED